MDTCNNSKAAKKMAKGIPECTYTPQVVKSIFLRKDINGEMELVVNDKVFRPGQFEFVKHKDGTASITFSL